MKTNIPNFHMLLSEKISRFEIHCGSLRVQQFQIRFIFNQCYKNYETKTSLRKWTNLELSFMFVPPYAGRNGEDRHSIYGYEDYPEGHDVEFQVGADHKFEEEEKNMETCSNEHRLQINTVLPSER